MLHRNNKTCTIKYLWRTSEKEILDVKTTRFKPWFNDHLHLQFKTLQSSSNHHDESPIRKYKDRLLLRKNNEVALLYFYVHPNHDQNSGDMLPLWMLMASNVPIKYVIRRDIDFNLCSRHHADPIMTLGL